ncbi:porin [Shigella flexneri]
MKYDANNIYLAAQYTQTYNATRFVGNLGWADKAQNFEVVASTSSTSVSSSIAYLQSKGKNLGVINGRNYDDEDILKYVDVGPFTTSTKTCLPTLSYKINLLDKNDFTTAAGISTDNIVALGMVTSSNTVNTAKRGRFASMPEFHRIRICADCRRVITMEVSVTCGAGKRRFICWLAADSAERSRRQSGWRYRA